MQRTVEIVTRIVYALSGAFLLTIGFVVIVLGMGILPDWIRDRIFEMGRSDPDSGDRHALGARRPAVLHSMRGCTGSMRSAFSSTSHVQS
jgi:hypothetical protein